MGEVKKQKTEFKQRVKISLVKSAALFYNDRNYNVKVIITCTKPRIF